MYSIRVMGNKYNFIKPLLEVIEFGDEDMLLGDSPSNRFGQDPNDADYPIGGNVF